MHSPMILLSLWSILPLSFLYVELQFVVRMVLLVVLGISFQTKTWDFFLFVRHLLFFFLLYFFFDALFSLSLNPNPKLFCMLHSHILCIYVRLLFSWFFSFSFY